MKFDWYKERFPYKKPLAVAGGIRAHSRREFGQSWWSKRWIEVIESLELGGRLERGRTYARRGQVVSIDVQSGKVAAVVQGSRDEPYKVRIGVATLTAEEWKRIGAEMARRPIVAAKLLAGEMPEDIESLFSEAGASLFPRHARDLQTDCSCPDESNPCKHTAAVYYLLAEEFERDPFLIFRLRGGSKEMLVGSKPSATSKPARQAAPLPIASEAWPEAVDAQQFWGKPIEDELRQSLEIPTRPAAILRRLGGFPFWRGESPLDEVVTPLYTKAAERALALLSRDRSPERDRD